MKALVTGGGGFIGSNIVRALLARGDEVVVLDNFLSGHRENLAGLNVRLIEADIRDSSAVQGAIAQCATVFHLAASVGNVRSIEQPHQDSEINVLGTLNVLEAAREAAVEKIVFSSSAGIFGELKTIPIKEDHPAEPDSPYGVSKLAAEKLCLAYSKLYSIEAVCLRYFNVYGPHQRFDAYGNVIPIFAFHLYRGEPITIFGDGEQTRDFVHVSDVVLANLKAADYRGASGVFNIASGSRITINRLATLMRAISGCNTPIVHSASRKGDVRHSLADISAARSVLGYEPAMTLERGLDDYLSWARPMMVNH
jgi:UDP-glucose 4-epimerase